MMKKLTLLFLIFVISSSPVLSSSDIPHKWKELEILIDEYGDEIRVHLKRDEKKLINLKFIWNNKEYLIGMEEFERIENPKMETLEVRRGAYMKGLISDKEEQYRIVKMNFGNKQFFNEYPSVEFYFFKGIYQFQLVTVKTGEATFQDYRKNPGEKFSIAGKTEPF